MERRQIMVALEDIEKGTYVLDWALNYLIPQASDSTKPDHFIILSVLPQNLLNNSYTTEDGMFQMDGLNVMEKHSKYMEYVKDACKKQNVTYEMKAIAGEAKQVICEAAKKLRVDLLVVGNNESRRPKRLFSTSKSIGDYCVQNAKCPVVVVKRRQNNKL